MPPGGALPNRPPKRQQGTDNRTGILGGKERTAWKQNLLIEKLNQQIRGWTNYHRSVYASEAFTHIDYVLYELLWRWAKRRHPHKGKWWVSTNYWHRRGNRNWVFSTEDKELLRVDHIPIIRHTKVRMDANPYDAVVILDDTGGKYVNFKLEFPKRKDGVHGKK